MIDALFFRRITFSFFEATAVHCASDTVTVVVYVGSCVSSGTGGGRGLLCTNNKPSTPRYSPLGKPAHPIDRPTGTIKQLFWGGGAFFFFCLRFAPFELQQSNQQNNNKNESLFLYCSMPLFSYIITTAQYPLNYVLQCLLFFCVWWLCMAINISVQNNSGLLPDIILLTPGRRVPRTMFFPWRLVQSI